MASSIVTLSTGLTFEPEQHIYTIHGQRVVSPSQVLRLLGITDPGKYAPGAAAFGTDVHALCELWDCGRLDLEDAPPDKRTKLEAWVRYEGLVHAEWEDVEVALGEARLLYAGLIDRVGTIDLGGKRQRVVLDIKSGQYEWWWALQLAAYRGLVDDGKYVARVSVQLGSNGEPRQHVYPVASDGSDWRTWCGGLMLAQRKIREERLWQ